MSLYDTVAYNASRQLTMSYSTSFGVSSKLFSKDIRMHIYAIYGLVRIADEIVDTYTGAHQSEILDTFEAETYVAITQGYSTNLIIHSFCITAKKFGIKKKYLTAFFNSMRMDLRAQTYTKELYETYIYGSAEVIGLMCLRVFCDGDDTRFKSLESGARALGAAYQKINFLRDFASDYKNLHRIYFPGVTYESFDQKTKEYIIMDITADIQIAKTSLARLPRSSRIAVATSLRYYGELLTKISRSDVETLKRKRIRINNAHKSVLLLGTTMVEKVKK